MNMKQMQNEYFEAKPITCCFTGHRKILKENIPIIKSNLRVVVVKNIENGYRFFEAGGALGFDTIAAQIVLELKEAYPQIRLILVLPCVTQTIFFDAFYPFNEGFLFVREFIVFNFDRMKLFQRYGTELSELRKL